MDYRSIWCRDFERINESAAKIYINSNLNDYGFKDALKHRNSIIKTSK